MKKRKAKRPYLKDSERRDYTLQLRLTESEAERIVAAAKKSSASLSAYVREKALGAPNG